MMYSKKEFTTKIYNLLQDAYDNPELSIYTIISRNKVSRTFATVLNKEGYLSADRWIGGAPTIYISEFLMGKLRAYQKECAKKAKSKKQESTKQIKINNVNDEEYALSILRNSDRYDYKVYRTLKQIKEEQVL